MAKGAGAGAGLFTKFVEPFLKKIKVIAGDVHARGVLGGQVYDMPGMRVTPEFSYTRRPRAELAQLRETFNGGVRQDFLKSLDQGALQRAGFSPTEIARIRAGKVPGRDWSVHHILPLDDGGTNSFDNLVLIRNSPDHQLVTNHQHYVTADLPVGDTRTVPWIHYPPGTRVWPPTPTANRPTIVTHPDVP